MILGGGYVGLYTALTVRRRLGRRRAAIALVDPRSYMTYQPFLPELAAGSLQASDVVVSHRRELKGVDVLTGRVGRIRHHERRVEILPEEGEAYEIAYDHLVVALGSVSRVLPVPGLAEQGMGFKQVEEALALHNHVLDRLDAASSTWDPALRRRMLTFTFVGAGFAGVEALAEVEDMARAATRLHEAIDPEDLRFVLVEAGERILPELGPDMGRYTLDQLRRRGIEVHLRTRMDSCLAGHVELSDATRFASETIVWTAGVRANPVLADSDLPLDDAGRVRCTPTLQVVGDDGVVPGAWAAGDCAAVPDLTRPGALCAPSAQHALRQARRLGENLTRVIRGEAPEVYRHRHAGTVASLGLGRGVARIYGVRLRGAPAWFMHRTYHMAMMPTLSRKIRVVLSWTTALLFRREVVALGRMHDPRAEFRTAAAVR